MAKQIGIKKTSFVVFIFIILCVGGSFWHQKSSEVRVFFKNPEEYRFATQVLLKIDRNFRIGDDADYIQKAALKCENIPLSNLYRRELTQCNPEWIECISQNQKVKNDLLGSGFEFLKFKSGKIYKPVSRSISKSSNDPYLGYEFKVKIEKEIFSTVVADTCHRSTLPEKEYIYREHSISDKDLLVWSSKNQKISIDKYLVLFEDIWRWKKITGSDVIIPHDRNKDLKYFILPADSLSKTQMQNYCSFRGGKVLETHILDAASFYPLKKEELDRAFAPYPWSLNRFNQELYQISNGKKEFNINQCFDSYFYECLSNSRLFAAFSKKDLSWIGIGDLIGGYPEYLDNKIIPFFNTRASSMYLPASHQMHRNGTRLHWTEQDYLGRSFLLEGQPFFGEINAIKLGFRCSYNE